MQITIVTSLKSNISLIEIAENDTQRIFLDINYILDEGGFRLHEKHYIK